MISFGSVTSLRPLLVGWSVALSVVILFIAFVFLLGKAIACAVDFDDQHCGIYAGDGDSYKDFAEVFDPIIQVVNTYAQGSASRSAS